MGIFKRISDIISANLNDLTDQYEDPEAMLRQAIREMEESIGDATQQTAKAMANEKTLVRELERNRQQSATWQDKAAAAVESGDDDLARRALSRRKEHEKLVVALEDQLEVAREASGSLQRQLDAMKAKLSEAKRNLATLAARQRAADFRKQLATQTGGISADLDDNAFAKFDRLKSRVEQAEAEAEALSELSGSGRNEPVAETSESSDIEVDADLAELKRKLKKK